MIEAEEASTTAVTLAVAVLAVAWICKDLVMATMKPVKPISAWTRYRWLRLIRREDYYGRHRYSRYA